MRKHKSVVAILLAVMMIFTFMPTMAFADVEEYTFNWSADLKSATVAETGASANISMDFDSTGLTTVTATYGGSQSTRYFYDFTGSSMILNGSMPWSEYESTVIYGNPSIKMLKPTGATGPDTATFTNTISLEDSAWYAEYDYDKDFEGGGNTIVKAKLLSMNSADHDGSVKSRAAKFGSVEQKTVTVAAPTDTVNYFYELVNGKKVAIDGSGEFAKDSTVDFGPYYDGTEHTIFAPAKANQSVKYQKYSNESGKWETVNAITYKNANTNYYDDEYRVVYTSTDVTQYASWGAVYLDIYVYNSHVTPTFGFTAPNATSGSFFPQRVYEITAAQAADPTAFIEIASGFDKEPAKSADLDEIKEVFGVLYKVDVKKNAIDENQQVWTIVPNADSEADWAKLLTKTAKAHKTLFANYDLDHGFGTVEGLGTTVNVRVVADPVVEDKDDLITFSGTVKQVYSGKKTTKKGKLKKAQSFKVKVANKSGKAMTFSYTTTNKNVYFDAATNKIKVKKNTKSGTYSVVVTAMTDAGNGYNGAIASQKYTVKIAK